MATTAATASASSPSASRTGADGGRQQYRYRAALNPPHLRDFELHHVSSAKACAVVAVAPSRGAAVVSFRGTKDAVDVLTDLTFLSVPFLPRAKAEEEARRRAEQEAREALTPEEAEKAMQLFDSRATDSGGEIGKEQFKELISTLIADRNAQAEEDGAEPTPLPSEKDLDAAFVRADIDESGMVDEEEFLVLYRDVKNGKVEGLGRGLFSAFFEAPFSLFKSGEKEEAVEDAAAGADEEELGERHGKEGGAENEEDEQPSYNALAYQEQQAAADEEERPSVYMWGLGGGFSSGGGSNNNNNDNNNNGDQQCSSSRWPGRRTVPRCTAVSWTRSCRWSRKCRASLTAPAPPKPSSSATPWAAPSRRSPRRIISGAARAISGGGSGSDGDGSGSTTTTTAAGAEHTGGAGEASFGAMGGGGQECTLVTVSAPAIGNEAFSKLLEGRAVGPATTAAA